MMKSPVKCHAFKVLPKPWKKMISVFTNARKKSTTYIGLIGNGIKRINSVCDSVTCFKNPVKTGILRSGVLVDLQVHIDYLPPGGTKSIRQGPENVILWYWRRCAKIKCLWEIKLFKYWNLCHKKL